MADNLSKYRAKRDFQKTNEPSGQAQIKPSNRRRFVIQKHDATRLHYDLRLELDGVFKSWAVTKGPSLDSHDKRLAVEVEDHPLDYGDFEGTIPIGQYGGGTVMLWDRGYWEPEGRKSPEEALRKGDFKFTLEGKRLHGSFVLVRMRNDRDGGSFCKTTGGRGLHVVTPLAINKRKPLSWSEAKGFTHDVCQEMARDNPGLYLIKMTKSLRGGRIFLDYLRNDRMATAVAPLSPRARPGATVSMPLNWTQVKSNLNPKRYTVRTVPALLAKTTAWQDYCDGERPLEQDG